MATGQASGVTSRVTFSKRSLEKLFGQQGQRLVIHDPKTPGLRAELREGGSIAFYVFKRVAGGGPVREKVGEFPEVTIDAARRTAKEKISKLAQGINIAHERRHKRAEPTLGELFAYWLESHAKPHKRTWAGDERQFNTLLKPWHNRKLSAIGRADVRSLHTRLGEKHGHYAANRLLALLAALFNRSADIGYEGLNPCKGVKKFREQSRERFLQPAELPAFFAAVKAEPNRTIADFFLACLYTGARRGNVASMRWRDVNLDNASWRIPQTKSGEPVTVHLAAPALELLKARKEIAEPDAEYVFPGRRSNGKVQHLSSPKFAWARLVKRAGLADLRLHDLRRTLGSFQAAAGASMAVIGKSLGHKAGSPATAVYARLNLDPVRASVDVATAAIVAAGNQNQQEVTNG